MKDRRKVCLVLVPIFFCLWSLAGCEALRRKFTRTKKRPAIQEEMIIVPRDYSAHPFANDVLYKQYFVYWKSWNQELVTVLNDRAPHKKIIDCAQQAIANLKKMASYLKDDKARELDVYIKKTEDLRLAIMQAKSMLPSHAVSLRYQAERILSNVNRQFDPRKTKDFLR